MERGTNVKVLIFKGKKEIILYTDGMGTSDLDSPHISIDTEWVGRIFKYFPEKAWNNTIINMNICVEYGTGDIWYSRVRAFEVVNDTKGNAGGCGEAGQALSPAPSFFPWQQ